MKKSILALICLALLTVACKKSKDAPALTKENVAGNYKEIAEVYKTQGQPDEDYYATLPDCQKDNIFHFNVDGNVNITDDGIVCDPSSAEQGTWSLDGTTFHIGEQTMTVSKWDGSTLELTYQSSGGGVEYTQIFTLKRQ